MQYCFFGHPKSASTFFGGIMGRVAIELGRKYFYGQIAIRGSMERVVKSNPEFIISQNSSYEAVEKLVEPFKGFHLIRDPRDICVSSYYSYKKTHAINNWKNLQKIRNSINKKNVEEGMMEVFDFNRDFFNHMAKWDFSNPNILELRYEEFISHSEKTIRDVFDFLNLSSNDSMRYSELFGIINRVSHKVGTWELLRISQAQISKKKIDQISSQLSFNKLSKGRSKGEENTNSHYRKGVSGDWKTFFTPSMKDKFKMEYGDLLIQLGYEEDLNW